MLIFEGSSGRIQIGFNRELPHTESGMMAQKAFHINDNGEIELCRSMSRCNSKLRNSGRPARDHWAEEEHVRIHLDNIAYLAEIKAKVDNFERIKGNMGDPSHFRWVFSGDNHNDSVRRFREAMDNYVANIGSLPVYLAGNLHYRLPHWRPLHNIYFDVSVSPVIDPETGKITRVWTAKVTEEDNTQWDPKRKRKVLHEVTLSFDDPKNFEASILKLKTTYVAALMATGKTEYARLEDVEYENLAETMENRFWEMFDALESEYRGQQYLWMELLRGDFKDSDIPKIVVDVNYDRSAFNGNTFREFTLRNHYFNGIIDADIRVTDEIVGHPRASWSLYRKDGIWSVVTRTFEGYTEDNLTPTAENVRSHVYWHVMRHVNIDKHEIAMKKADYAADLFTAVEEELASRTHVPE